MSQSSSAEVAVADIPMSLEPEASYIMPSDLNSTPVASSSNSDANTMVPQLSDASSTFEQNAPAAAGRLNGLLVPCLHINTTTWARDSHELFDYEARHVYKKSYFVKCPSKIFRTSLEVQVIPDGLALPSEPADYLLSIRRRDGRYVVAAADKNSLVHSASPAQMTPKRVWVIIKDLPRGHHKLQESDVIKLGRFKLRIKQLVKRGPAPQPELRLDTTEVPHSNLTPTEAATMQCRICLLDGGTEEDPLLCPCHCKGSIKFIHLECLRQWISGRLLLYEDNDSKSFFFKHVQCELCKTPFPSAVIANGTHVPIIEVPRVEAPFIILENMGGFNRGLHVISMEKRKELKLGRGHESDIRIADVSISRYHATIRFVDGEYVLEDNNSKFGTLVSLRKSQTVEATHPLALQVGRTVLNFSLATPPCDFDEILGVGEDSIMSPPPGETDHEDGPGPAQPPEQAPGNHDIIQGGEDAVLPDMQQEPQQRCDRPNDLADSVACVASHRIETPCASDASHGDPTFPHTNVEVDSGSPDSLLNASAASFDPNVVERLYACSPSTWGDADSASCCAPPQPLRPLPTWRYISDLSDCPLMGRRLPNNMLSFFERTPSREARDRAFNNLRLRRRERLKLEPLVFATNQTPPDVLYNPHSSALTLHGHHPKADFPFLLSNNQPHNLDVGRTPMPQQTYALYVPDSSACVSHIANPDPSSCALCKSPAFPLNCDAQGRTQQALAFTPTSLRFVEPQPESDNRITSMQQAQLPRECIPNARHHETPTSSRVETLFPNVSGAVSAATGHAMNLWQTQAQAAETSWINPTAGGVVMPEKKLDDSQGVYYFQQNTELGNYQNAPQQQHQGTPLVPLPKSIPVQQLQPPFSQFPNELTRNAMNTAVFQPYQPPSDLAYFLNAAQQFQQQHVKKDNGCLNGNQNRPFHNPDEER